MAKKKLVTIQADYSAAEIVEDAKKQLKTASELYEKYLESEALFHVDTVTNAEFLRKGWSQNTIHNDLVAKEATGTFAFVMNLKDAECIVFQAALQGDDVYVHPATITFSAGSTELGKVEIRYSQFSQYLLTVPEETRKSHVVIKGSIEKDDSTKVLFRYFTATKKEVTADSVRGSLFELEKMKRDTNQLIQILSMHKNPEHLLPASAQRRGLKKVAKKMAGVMAKIPPVKKILKSLILKRIVLKLIRPFTTPQIQFNQYMVELLQLQTKRLDKLEQIFLSNLEVDPHHEKKNSSTG